MKSFLINAAILTLTSLSMRGIGMVFRIFLTERIGADGMGLYSLILSVYTLGITLATSGIHLAVTRVVAEEAAVGNGGGVQRVMKNALRYALLLGCGSGILQYLLSPALSVHWLKDERCCTALRILAFSLPAVAVSGVVGGYFTGIRKAYRGAQLSFFGQILQILCTVVLLRYFLPHGLEWACAAIGVGCTVSELCTAGLGYLQYRRRKSKASSSGSPGGETRRLFRIALPIAATSYARSALLTVEHVLIPIGLVAYGASRGNALASYGTIHGMVMPTVLFPMAALSAVAGLIIPELAEYHAAGCREAIERNVSKLLRLTLLFGIGVSSVFLCFADELGTLLYHSEEAGRYLRIFGALVPVMYLDHIVDAALKGLDEQVASMRYNLIDASLSVAAVWLLLPRYGITAYVMIVFGSEILNFTLSFTRLFRVCRIRLPLIRCVGVPILCGAASVALCSFLFRHAGLSYFSPVTAVIGHLLVSTVLYAAFLAICGAIPGLSLRKKRIL